jgi:hypothetical protein
VKISRAGIRAVIALATVLVLSTSYAVNRIIQ